MPATQQWLVDLLEEQGTTLHRLATMLGARRDAEEIVKAAGAALGRRDKRIVDPRARVEYLQEFTVQAARGARGNGRLHLPKVEDAEQQEILDALCALPVRASEILVASHYLGQFGPELATIMQMTLRTSNLRLEEALEQLARELQTNGSTESLSADLTAALRASARRITTDSEAIEAADLEPVHSGIRVNASLATVAVIGSLLLGAWLPIQQQTAGHNEPTPESSPSAMAGEARAMPTRAMRVPVYYVSRDENFAFVEHRNMALTGDLLTSALNAVMTLAPLDPDYVSLWGAGEVRSVEVTDEEVVVNLSGAAYEGISSERAAEMAKLQMAYTLRELLGRPEMMVRFVSDGNPPPELFVEPVYVTDATATALPLVWITSPRNADNVSKGEVRITGAARAEATVPEITIADESGQVVFSTSAQTATQPRADGWRPWIVATDLNRGTYTVTATVSRVGESDHPSTISDTKKITVQ